MKNWLLSCQKSNCSSGNRRDGETLKVECVLPRAFEDFPSRDVTVPSCQLVMDAGGRRPVWLTPGKGSLWSSQRLGSPLSFGRALLSAGVGILGGASASRADGQCAHGTQPRSFLMTALKITAWFYLVTTETLTSVRVTMLLMEAPGPPAIWHNPTSMAKLMQLGMEPACDLQALCHVGEKGFFLYFSFTLGKSPSAHTHVVVTGHPPTISGIFVAVNSCQETICCWFLALFFAFHQPNIKDFLQSRCLRLGDEG